MQAFYINPLKLKTRQKNVSFFSTKKTCTFVQVFSFQWSRRLSAEAFYALNVPFFLGNISFKQHITLKHL
jgi:hypothetical protein